MPDKKPANPEPPKLREAKKRWPKKREQQELLLFFWCAGVKPVEV
jgi:hypothetical protein